MTCRVCENLCMHQEHPDYPDPELGDVYHGQYDPNGDLSEFDAHMRWTDNGCDLGPTDDQLMNWNEHNDHIDGYWDDYDESEDEDW